MQFRTEINLKKSDLQIEHQNTIITLGSCFAENIAEHFKRYRFDVSANPFGVLYNPVSIYNAIRLLDEKKSFTKDDLFYDQGEWHSFYHHSDFSHHDVNVCLKNINDGLVDTRKLLEQTDIVIITYGTSYVYEHIDKKNIVSNCHKISAKEFNRFRLSVEEVKQNISATLELLKKINKNARVIFTVSPVRHWKDGAVDNQLSKSILLLAVNDTIQENKNAVYFPSYEILMDDLRDYRFYESDLVHPNKLATSYIWGKFTTAHLSDECEDVIGEIEPVIKARLHRTRNKYSESNIKFLNSQIALCKRLMEKYSHLNLNDDVEYFQSELRDIDSAK